MAGWRPTAGQLATLAALGLLVVGWFLRLYKASRQSLSADEILTLQASQSPTLDAFLHSYAGVDHPPLHFLFERLWTPFAGSSEFALRAPSAMAGVLTLAALYHIGRRGRGWGLGLAAMTFGAVAPFWVFFGQESRGYAFMIAGVSFALWQALRVADRPGRWRRWAVWGLLAAFSALVEYTALPALAVQGLFLLWTAWRSRQWPGLLLAGGIPAVLFGAWVLYAAPVQSVAQTSNPLTPKSSPLQVFTEGMGAFASGNFLPEQWLSVTLVPLAVALMLGLANRRTGWAWRALLAGSVVVPFAAVALVGTDRLGFHPRYLLAASPALLLLAAAGLDVLGRWRPAPVLLGGLLLAPALAGLNNYYNQPFFGRPDFRGAADFLARGYRSGDLVIYNAPWTDVPFLYYSPREWEAVGLPESLPLDQGRTDATLDRLSAAYPRVWLVRWQDWFTDPPQYIRHRLEARATKFAEQGFAYVTVEGFLTQPVVTPGLPGQTLADFGGKARLARFEVDTRHIGENSRLVVTLYWRSNGPTTERYKVFVHVSDAAGRLVAQQDHEPVYGRLPTSFWPPNSTIRDEYEIDLPPDLAPGAYTLLAGLYDEATGVRLPVSETGADHAVLTDQLQLDGRQR